MRHGKTGSMRHGKTGSTGKLAVVIASALLGGLVGAPAVSAGDDDFTLTGRFTDFDREDNGDRGWSEGDKVDFAFDLFDGRDDAGDGDGTCVITKLDRREHDFAADCDVTFDLEGDDGLDMEGEVTDEDFREGEVVLDVVGGAGAYDDADGTATFSSARGQRGRGGHDHHGMSAADAAGMMMPMHAGGDGDGGHDRDGGRRHGRDGGRGNGGDRRFKVDVDLD